MNVTRKSKEIAPAIPAVIQERVVIEMTVEDARVLAHLLSTTPCGTGGTNSTVFRLWKGLRGLAL